MSLIGQKITILGAGIGGLTAALALSRRGAQVEVLERADTIREAGAGIQISPNGMAVLHALGLDEEIAQRSLAGRRVELRDHRTGSLVLGMDLAALPSKHPWLLAHRSDVIAVLAAAAETAGVTIRTQTDVCSVEAEGDIELHLAEGGSLGADVLIGADGVRSVVRAALGEGEDTAFTGQVAWRATVPLDEPEDPVSRVYLGPGCHVVTYPLRDGRMMNLVMVQERPEWADEAWRQSDDPAIVRTAFAGFAPEVRSLIDRIRQVHLWGLFRHPVARQWHRNRIALLGDAAHPTLPFLAQGACMALEDAWVLAAALAESSSVEEGFARYQHERRARCERIVAAADRNAWAYHLRPGPVRLAAHGALRLGGALRPTAALRQFDWLYGEDVTA
jgi:salicylate hydroxylase